MARDYNIARLGESNIKSTAFVWQGSWLGDTVLPLVGLRRDEVENRNFQAGTDADGIADPVIIAGHTMEVMKTYGGNSYNRAGRTYLTLLTTFIILV